MDLEQRRRLAGLIRTHRWAALATQGKDGPEASWVAYAWEADFSAFYLHLSRLASHTRNLLAEPLACLAITETDQAGQDPQQLARVSIQGRVVVVEREAADYRRCAERYQARLPDSVPLFEFGDFLLLRLCPVRARFVGGFAQAHTLDAAALVRLGTGA